MNNDKSYIKKELTEYVKIRNTQNVDLLHNLVAEENTLGK